MTCVNVMEMIGNTKMVKLCDNDGERKREIYMKIEDSNPGGSIKDRAVAKMLTSMLKSGKLKEGDTVIEPTSGNTGISLAMIGKRLGLNVSIVMPETMTAERRNLIKIFGANLVLTDGTLGMKGAIEKANSLLATTKGSVLLGQFDNQDNAKAHYETTGVEIFNSVGDVDYFVCGVGTGGTIMGTGRRLKETNSGVKIIAVEPANSPVLSGGEPGAHKIQGIGAGFVPSIIDLEAIDEIIKVTDEEAAFSAKMLLDDFGIFAGISSGANYFAAKKIAESVDSDKKIVTISPDGGMKYLSMGIY